MITNIEAKVIIKDLLNIILTKYINNYPKKVIEKVIEIASFYEYRLNKGRRDIIHIESFILGITNFLNKN